MHVRFGCMQELLVCFEHERRVYAGVVFIIWQCTVLQGNVTQGSFSTLICAVPSVSRSGNGLCACDIVEWVSCRAEFLLCVSFWTSFWMAFTKRGWAKRCLTSPGPLDNAVSLSQLPRGLCSFTFALLWSVCFGATLALGLFSLTWSLLGRHLLSCEGLVTPQIAGVALMETSSGDATLALVMCWDADRSGCGFTAMW